MIIFRPATRGQQRFRHSVMVIKRSLINVCVTGPELWVTVLPEQKKECTLAEPGPSEEGRWYHGMKRFWLDLDDQDHTYRISAHLGAYGDLVSIC